MDLPSSSCAPPKMSNIPSSNLHRIIFLDALRFIAAAAVLLQHSLERYGELGRKFCDAVSPGVFGVVLFFVISGFVIPMTAGKTFELRRFAIRRVFRIYPLVIFAFSAVAIAGWFGNLPEFAMARSASLGDWAANLLLIQDYVHVEPLLGVTWTLSLEFAWYALFAASLLCLGRRFDDWLAIGAPLAMIALVAASIWFGHRLPLGRIGMIYIAILGCRTYRHFIGEISARRLAIDASVFIIVTTIGNVVSFGYFRHPNITMMQAVVPWIVAPVLFLFVSGIPRVNHSKFFNSTVLGWLGAISFSTYLLHPLALAVAKAYSPSDISLIVGLLLTLLLSIVGYRFVEMPGQALGRQLTLRSGMDRALGTSGYVADRPPRRRFG